MTRVLGDGGGHPSRPGSPGCYTDFNCCFLTPQAGAEVEYLRNALN